MYEVYNLSVSRSSVLPPSPWQDGVVRVADQGASASHDQLASGEIGDEFARTLVSRLVSSDLK